MLKPEQKSKKPWESVDSLMIWRSSSTEDVNLLKMPWKFRQRRHSSFWSSGICFKLNVCQGFLWWILPTQSRPGSCLQQLAFCFLHHHRNCPSCSCHFFLVVGMQPSFFFKTLFPGVCVCSTLFMLLQQLVSLTYCWNQIKQANTL